MSGTFRNMVWMSISRRKKDVRRVSLIAFLAAAFIMGTLRFQESMDLYQNRAN